MISVWISVCNYDLPNIYLNIYKDSTSTHSFETCGPLCVTLNCVHIEHCPLITIAVDGSLNNLAKPNHCSIKYGRIIFLCRHCAVYFSFYWQIEIFSQHYVHVHWSTNSKGRCTNHCTVPRLERSRHIWFSCHLPLQNIEHLFVLHTPSSAALWSKQLPWNMWPFDNSLSLEFQHWEANRFAPWPTKVIRKMLFLVSS
jgi:hypothetical protein